MSHRKVFVTGGSGYLGRRLIPELLRCGHHVRALVRKGSESKIPPGCTLVFANALDESTFSESVPPSDTFVQLVGVSHPSPSKAQEFRAVDLASVRASVSAAEKSGVSHFIYVSVAQPAPVMKEYINVRAEGEALVRESKLNATILRPWYVLGPEHRWPYAFFPVYWILELIPSARDSARRLGLVTLHQMIRTLVAAVENPSSGIRILEVPHIKQSIVESASPGS
ncbi:MAG: NAD(P)H-binding protein [Ignavibacteriales bacterium]|nr:NAD(P)H-binding protein [Ignavibacteriales bacterium]